MHLLLHEAVHLSISLLIGYLVWKIYKKPLPAFAAALLGGIFIDFDHLFDYFLLFGSHFNLYSFLHSYQFMISKKVYVPLHAWEWVILLSFLYRNLEKKFKKNKINTAKYFLSFLLALTLGIYSHLMIDTITNEVVPLGYSIIYRAVNGFNSDKISLFD